MNSHVNTKVNNFENNFHASKKQAKKIPHEVGSYPVSLGRSAFSGGGGYEVLRQIYRLWLDIDALQILDGA